MRNILNISNSNILIVCSTFLIIITVLFLFEFLSVDVKASARVFDSPQIMKNQNPVDLKAILVENTKNNITEEMVLEEIDLEYTTEYRNNCNLPKGTIQVLQEGRDGKQEAIILKRYENDELISEELVAENLIKASVNKIVEIGTGIGSNNYKAKVGDKVFVTSNSLAVRLFPDENSEKLCTLKKDTEVKIVRIEDNWVFISCSEQNGYIASNCITNIDPKKGLTQVDENLDGVSKNTLVANLDFSMDLSKPSGLSLEQFKKILEGQAQDKNNVFNDNAEYFYYAEKQYGLNGVFLAAVGIHESGWGTSTISVNKKNLFGYGAVDSNPYGGAYSFGSYSEGIDLLARVFVKYYLNPAGTIIYDGSKCDGRFYSGNNLSSVNVKYASDKNWANSVYKWMTLLYNNL